MNRVLVLDVMEDGSVVPVTPENVDWGTPPEVWPRPMRRRFKRLFESFRIEYKMPDDIAHYKAMVRAHKERRITRV